MNFPTLMAGILLAAFIFGASLYALLQCFRTVKAQRVANIAVIAGVLAGMASIQFLAPTLAFLSGIFLIVTALTAAWYEEGLSKILPGMLVIFGILLALGLPFAA